jgi:sialic acid synthase SpsE
MTYSKLVIGNREIGDQFPPFVIPEIGINHGGSFETAVKMIDAAHQAGAEVVKFQTHIPEEEMSVAAKGIIPGNADQSIYDIMTTCSLSLEEERAVKKYVESKGMIFLSTPFSKAAVARLEELGVVAYKIGSGECNNLPLLEYIATLGKPIILSTGMNTLEQIKSSVSILQKHSASFALLHCTNLYPTPPELVRLGGIQHLKSEFPGVVVGLSDHTRNNNAALAATALGASILERHFTDVKDQILFAPWIQMI